MLFAFSIFSRLSLNLDLSLLFFLSLLSLHLSPPPLNITQQLRPVASLPSSSNAAAAATAAAAAAPSSSPPISSSSTNTSNANLFSSVDEHGAAALSGRAFVMSKLMKEEAHTEEVYLAARARNVRQHFPTALGADDFMQRLEVALFAHGFTGENSIAMSNLCRDEITSGLKHRIDHVFGSSFNTNGLGGVLTCGVTGVKAGLSHSPVSASSGKERYVFFSFPHIAIDAAGAVGAIARPGRPGGSCACGALDAALGDIRRDGLEANCLQPGLHDPLDPEYSILKQRLARRIRYEGLTDEQVEALDLCEMTRVADRTITDDLEYLIKHSVDVRRVSDSWQLFFSRVLKRGERENSN